MTALYDRLVKIKGGSRALAAARLRNEVLRVLHTALHSAQMTQSELAARLGVRKSAVNQVFKGDGNLRITTLAEYLHELGFELQLKRVTAGQPREDAVRAMNDAHVRGTALLAKKAPVSNLADVHWNEGAYEQREVLQPMAVQGSRVPNAAVDAR